ncbi:MAG TPA: PEP-CTERM sorting domain-containing protein [bacterium]
MRRFLCCLGVFGLLAGGSLVLPGAASAQQACDVIGPSDFAIKETPFFQTAATQGTETYDCTLGLGLTPGSFDLLEPGIAPPFNRSDSISFLAGGTGITVHMVSDTLEFAFPSSSNNQIQETLIACPPGFGPEPGGDPSGFCNGADHVQLLNAVTGAPLGVTLTVYSDIQAVPEPSTGLLLGAALPALLGIRRRFSMRVSA